MAALSLGLSAVLTLTAATLLGDSTRIPDLGEHNVSDGELFDRVLDDGDVLFGCTFEWAVQCDPRRIEALLLQRVVLQFYLLADKISEPNVPLDRIKVAMKRAYLARQAELRKIGYAGPIGAIDACKIAEAFRAEWKMYGEVLRVAFEMDHPEAQALCAIMAKNKDLIARAFAESKEIANQASKYGPTPECSLAWRSVSEIIGNMSNLVDRHVSDRYAKELIETQGYGADGSGDGHGADIERGRDLFGAGAWEEYIVTGHRAPSVALPAYRRMGGRVYG